MCRSFKMVGAIRRKTFAEFLRIRLMSVSLRTNRIGEKVCQSTGIFIQSMVRIFSKNGRLTYWIWLGAGKTSMGGVLGRTIGWCREEEDEGAEDEEAWWERDERDRVLLICWILFANWGVKLALISNLQRWSRSRFCPPRVTLAESNKAWKSKETNLFSFWKIQSSHTCNSETR